MNIIEFIQNSPIISAVILLLAGMFPVGDTSLFGLIVKWLAEKVKKPATDKPDELVALNVTSTATLDQVSKLISVADHATRFGRPELAAKIRGLIPEVVELGGS